MSLHIYIAHSGEHLLADPVSFASYVPLLASSTLVCPGALFCAPDLSKPFLDSPV